MSITVTHNYFLTDDFTVSGKVVTFLSTPTVGAKYNIHYSYADTDDSNGHLHYHETKTWVSGATWTLTETPDMEEIRAFWPEEQEFLWIVYGSPGSLGSTTGAVLRRARINPTTAAFISWDSAAISGFTAGEFFTSITANDHDKTLCYVSTNAHVYKCLNDTLSTVYGGGLKQIRFSGSNVNDWKGINYGGQYVESGVVGANAWGGIFLDGGENFGHSTSEVAAFYGDFAVHPRAIIGQWDGDPGRDPEDPNDTIVLTGPSGGIALSAHDHFSVGGTDGSSFVTAGYYGFFHFAQYVCIATTGDSPPSGTGSLESWTEVTGVSCSPSDNLVCVLPSSGDVYTGAPGVFSLSTSIGAILHNGLSGHSVKTWVAAAQIGSTTVVVSINSGHSFPVSITTSGGVALCAFMGGR